MPHLRGARFLPRVFALLLTVLLDGPFSSADSGGERAAAVYSLIGTAKLGGVAPKRGCAMC